MIIGTRATAAAASTERRGLGAETGGPRIAVVGGGIAGLNAAWHLKQRGLHATVYEARDRVGGRMQTRLDAVGDGLVTDLGGSLVNSDHADILGLAEEFGLELTARAANVANLDVPIAAYYVDGVIRSEAEVASALRPLAAQIAADAELLDADWDRYAPSLDALSVAGYLDRHASLIQEMFIRTLVEQTIRTEYGVEPAESSVLQLIFSLPTVEGEAVELLGASDEYYVFAGGSERLIDALARALDGQVETQRRLTRVAAEGDTFRLTFDPDEEVVADIVILAVPLPVLKTIAIDADVPELMRRFITEVDLGRNERILAGFEERAWRREGGFGLEAWTGGGLSQAWDETIRQPDRPDGALTLYVGGDNVATLSDAADDGARLLAELDAYIPSMSEASNGRFFRTDWTGSPYTGGGYVSFKPGQYTTFGACLYIESDDAEERQDVHAGRLIFAGEHLSDEYNGYMNGGAQTGRLAAAVAARLIASADHITTATS